MKSGKNYDAELHVCIPPDCAGVGAHGCRPPPRTVFFHVHAAFPGLGAAIAVILYFTIASPISQ